MRPYALFSILLVLFTFGFLSEPTALAREKISLKTELNEKTYPAVLKALKKLPVETHWKEIPWRPNFGEAIEDARKEDKPILLWVMNGHPCGMT